MIGVIADDLTGAAEIGAIGLRHGLHPEVVVSRKPNGAADLICIDTDSRSCNAEEARRRVALAARSLRKAGANWIYKKVDSVLRGNVTAEVEAVMKAIPADRALMVPANPGLGRIIRDGRYFICGKPIDQTEFARDPEYPRSFSKVLELLGRPKYFPIHVCGAKHSSLPPGIVVGEAKTEADLRIWADYREERILMAGAAEFFGALLKAEGCAPATTFPKNISLPRGKELFVCGTASRSVRAMAGIARAQHVPVVSLPAELAWGVEFGSAAMEAVARRIIAAFKSHSRVVLMIGLPLARQPFIAGELTPHLIRVAEMVLRRIEVGHVYAEGGATAAALVRRMGWERLTVWRELAPGVATLMVDGNKSFLLTIKPGSYAWPSTVLNGTVPHVSV